MKRVVWRCFIDYEREEGWLNKMSAQGLALTDYSWCRYVFAETTPHKYIYRMELLDNLATDPESSAYIRFLEENGIEHVASFQRWIYVRRESSQGDFDIYTDLESKLKHYKRVSALWNSLMVMEFSLGLINIAIALLIGAGLTTAFSFFHVNLIVGLVCTALGFGFLRLIEPINRKVKELEREREIRE